MIIQTTCGTLRRTLLPLRSVWNDQVRQASFRSIRPLATQSSSRHGRQWRITYGAGLAFGIAFLAVLASNSSTLHLEAPHADQKDSRGGSEPADVRLDPATSLPFPLVLPTPQSKLPSGHDELQLVGLGVRTVSFLGIRVYVAALYIDSRSLQRLTSLPGWRGFEARWMTDKKAEDDVHSSEAMLATLIDSGATLAIRIVPTRSTDFNHLKDGFTRAVQNRAKLARKDKQLSPEADEALNKALQDLKEAFPKASLPKGRALDLLFTHSASGLDLTLEEDGKVLGSVRAAKQTDQKFTLARQLLLAYFANKDEISKPFKQSVAEGFQDRIQAS